MTANPKIELGSQIRKLMKKRGVSGRRLSERLNVSKTTISKILTGKARPKQDTFSEICTALCHDDHERNELIEAYTGVRPTSTAATKSLRESYPARQETVEQRLQDRVREWPFKEIVSNQLHEWGMQYKRNIVCNEAATDILITQQGRRIAVECRADFDLIDVVQERLLFQTIKQSGLCDTIYMVVPDTGLLHKATLEDMEVVALRFLKDLATKTDTP